MQLMNIELITFGRLHHRLKWLSACETVAD